MLLMSFTVRTIGIEGRCFVVSSNMCVRDAGLGAATERHQRQQQTTSTTSASTSTKGVDDKPKPRRNSCITEEGFEIALPSPLKTSASPPAQRVPVRDVSGKAVEHIPPPTGSNVGASLSSAILREEDNPSTTGTTTTQHQTHPGQKVNPGAEATFVSRGGSSIVSPFGDVLAGPQWEDDEGIIYADVDMEDCVRGRLDLDAAGSYSR
jgi:nitrilase